MAGWYFQEGSSYQGPVTVEVLRKLISDRRINETTLIWSASTGGEWRPLREAGTGIIFAAPPPLPASHINDVFVWTIAFMPIIGSIAERVLASNFSRLPPSQTAVFVCYVAAYTALSALDIHQIEVSGRKNTRTVLLGWALVIPIYLYLRARAVGRWPVQLLLWVLALVAVAAFDTFA